MVIILDNVSIHIAGSIVNLIQDVGHVVKFLPPYSLDFNPIELTFAVLKRWVKRNYFYERGDYPNYEAYL
jgi:transposase